MSENSIEFSLSNSEQRDSWLNSGHWTLDADNGILKKIISNRGPQFASTFIGELCKALGIKRAMSIAYHP